MTLMMTPGNDLLFVGYYLTRDDEGVKTDKRCSNACIIAGVSEKISAQTWAPAMPRPPPAPLALPASPAIHSQCLLTRV